MKPCRVEACGRRVRKNGLCFGHLRNGERSDVATRRSGSARDELGRKHCRTCDQWLKVEEFTKDFRSKDGRRSICLTCHSAKRRIGKYGVSADWFGATFKSQGERCAICQRHRSLAIRDHLLAGAHVDRPGRVMWWRRNRQPEPEPLHRGRIWFEDGWWRYACTDCDYGAGSRSAGWITHRWLIKNATDHADPSHWSRNRGK